jgi:hypothetical protein
VAVQNQLMTSQHRCHINQQAIEGTPGIKSPPHGGGALARAAHAIDDDAAASVLCICCKLPDLAQRPTHRDMDAGITGRPPPWRATAKLEAVPQYQMGCPGDLFSCLFTPCGVTCCLKLRPAEANFKPCEATRR